MTFHGACARCVDIRPVSRAKERDVARVQQRDEVVERSRQPVRDEAERNRELGVGRFAGG